MEFTPDTSLLKMLKAGVVLKLNDFNDGPYVRRSHIGKPRLKAHRQHREKYFDWSKEGLQKALNFAQGVGVDWEAGWQADKQ